MVTLNNSRLVIVFFVLGLTLMVTGAKAAVVEITREDAKVLLLAALSDGRSEVKANLEADALPTSASPGFYAFQVVSAVPRTPAILGSYAINPRNGDVWSLAGYCHRLESGYLRQLRGKILRMRHINSIRTSAIERPSCDADIK